MSDRVSQIIADALARGEAHRSARCELWSAAEEHGLVVRTRSDTIQEDDEGFASTEERPLSDNAQAAVRAALATAPEFSHVSDSSHYVRPRDMFDDWVQRLVNDGIWSPERAERVLCAMGRAPN